MTAHDFGKVAVLLGGESAERAISLQSGQAVLAALCRQNIDAHAVDTGEPSWLATLQAGEFMRVFIALHGRGGEDGVVQGALELLGLPYTGSGVLASALSMDKRRCKDLWRGVGLPTPAFRMLRSEADCAAAIPALGLPLMVKPAREGSSVGISRVTEAAALVPAWREASRYDSQVLAEQFIEGDELTVSVLDGETLPPVRIETPRAFYDYQAKYLQDDTRYHCPSGLSQQMEDRARQLALAAFEAVDGRGWGRVDFLVDRAGTPWLIEVNTVPGLTDHSLVPMAAQAAGLDFDGLVRRILATSLTEQG